MDRADGVSSSWRVLMVTALVVLVWASVASSADAASPAWKILAATGPTNIPPQQSEVQRVTVEAEGGSFQLGLEGGEGKLTPVFRFGIVSTTEGSNVATVGAGGEPLEVGARVIAGGFPFEGETFVVSCSPDCTTAGSTVTFSGPAVETVNEESIVIQAKEATVEEGSFAVGDELRGNEAEIFLPGTEVTAVSGSKISLSKAPAEACFACEAESVSIIHKTAPISYAAPATTVQGALEAIPALGPGSVTVTGGPGGTAEHPYFLAFGGPFTNQDVQRISPDPAGLVGEGHAVNVFTTVPGGPGTAQITINPANIGGATTLGEYKVELGPLPEGIITQGAAEGEGWVCPGGAGDKFVTCTSGVPVAQLTAANNITVPLEVTQLAEFSGAVPVSIAGGGAASDATQMPVTISRQQAKNGVSAFWAGAFDANGNLETQAGGHPYSAATYFLLNTIRLPDGHIVTPGDARNVIVDLPPGFSGNPLVTPRCPQSRLVPSPVSGGAALCNQSSRVGRFQPVSATFGKASHVITTFWNDVPPQGYAAEFTTEIAGPLLSILGSVRSSEDFGVRISALNIPNFERVYGSFAALEGFPAGAGGKPLLTNASSCAENAREAPVSRTKIVETWQEPGAFSPPAESVLPSVTGCDKLEFTPSFDFRPSTTQGSSGTGATASLRLPQGNLLEATKLAQPALKKAVVTLPAGLTLNPSSANGLEACSEDQIGYLGKGSLPNPNRFDESAPRCPNGSKLGTVKVKTPLLEEELEGTIYLAEQERNPFGSLIALYLAIESPRFGLEVKLPGEVRPDPETGQLTATFDYNPQVAFEELELNFRGGGPRSELATPEVCGHYSTTGSLEPWSAPESGPPAQIQEGGFDVSSGCASSADKRPFSPTFEAGTTGTQAGAYSPLVIKVNRKDGEQELKTLEFSLPKGLVGKLAGIPYCSDSAIAAASSMSGKAEEASPSCPSASQVGTVDAAAGVGSEPFHVGGKVYLAGPYKGAPLSSVVITPAVAGPFDLGDVVIRAPLYVNPETAEITAKSDPIPTILKGIPLKMRSVAINLDRSDFTLNPTSCEPMKVIASIGGSSGTVAKPTNRFQVGGCKQLKFKPTVKISLRGATKRTGLPALKAVVTYPKQGAYANIAGAQVNLPHSEFLEQNNLDKTCTKPVLLEGKCSKHTIYGKAKAWTPLLDKPLEGPVYLVGGYGYKLPALVAELNGQIRILLKGKVDSGPNKGIRSTFEAVPDAPVSRFVLEMKGGKKYGLLINSENLCREPQHGIARFTAQNGLSLQSKPLIANQCGKKGKKSSKGKPKKDRAS
jgi:hypothetical protein